MKVTHALLLIVALSVSSLAANAEVQPSHIASADNEQLKSQRKAFLLNFFCGFSGAGMFYIDKDVEGFAQTALFGTGAAILTYGIAELITPRTAPRTPAPLLKPIFFASWGGAFAYWVVNNVRFGFNLISDGNGQPLKPW